MYLIYVVAHCAATVEKNLPRCYTKNNKTSHSSLHNYRNELNKTAALDYNSYCIIVDLITFISYR